MNRRRIEFRALETERLLLRRPRAEDAKGIHAAYASDPAVTRFLTWRPHVTVAESAQALSGRIDRLERGVEYSWLIELRARAGEIIGVISAWPGGDAVELGFALARESWSRGIATEAVVAVQDWAFESAGIERVWATCDFENRASARVLEKAGLDALGVFDRQIIRPNLAPTPRPSLLFSKHRPV